MTLTAPRHAGEPTPVQRLQTPASTTVTDDAWPWALVAAGAASLLYGGFVAWLLLAGRREDGCALAAGCESHSAASRMRTSDRSALIRKLIPSFAQKPRIPAVLPAEVQDKARR